MEDLMRKDITYIDGVQMEEAVEIARHCFFQDDEMEVIERVIRTPEEFKNAYMDYIQYWNFERCISEMHTLTGKETFYYYGNCAVCSSPQPFIVDYQFAEEVNGRKTPNWRERLVCPNCGCNSRQRFIIHKVFDSYKVWMDVLMYEQTTNIFQKISREIPGIKGFEYPGEGYCLHTIQSTIPCENISKLSMGDESYDLLVANDVFELVYDYESAFAEAFRVLKPGGKMIFMLAFDGNSKDTVTRVEMGCNGLVHTQSEWYYSNPIDEKSPRLVCQVFGWDVLDVLKKCGFQDAYGKVYYGLKEGYLGYLPIYFEAIK